MHLCAPETKTEHFWSCVWQSIILKNCNIVRRQHLDHRMHLATSNVEVFTGSNLTLQSKNRTSTILDTAAQIIKIWLHVSQLEPGIQDERLPWVMCKHELAWCWEHHDGWLTWPHYVFPIIRWPLFHLLSLFSVIRCLAISALPWMLDLWCSHQTVFVETFLKWILSSAVTSAAVLLWFIVTFLFNVSLSFCFFDHYSS